jgi:DNA-binding MarR family transcriptional regulator
MQEERFELFTLLISEFEKDIQKIKAARTKALGIKNVHALWLYLLYKNPDGLSAAQIAEKSRINRSLVSREIDALADKGYVRTTEATGKRRYNWKFVLTQDGIALARQIGEIALEVQTYADRDITQDELEQFYTTLQKLKANFSYITDTIDKGEKK